jgi:hypothetical protein
LDPRGGAGLGCAGRVHCPDAATVEAFDAAALAAGGNDNGPPRERPNYHPGYYAAYVHDFDGTNVEAVFHDLGGTV